MKNTLEEESTKKVFGSHIEERRLPRNCYLWERYGEDEGL